MSRRWAAERIAVGIRLGVPAKPRELTRRYLEALAVAQAVVDPPLTLQLLEMVDPLCVSPAVMSLLDGIAANGEAVEIFTKRERELAGRVNAITVADLRGIGAYSLATLVALLNQLRQRPAPTSAWERDLAIGVGAAGAT